MSLRFVVEGLPQLRARLQPRRYAPPFRDFHQDVSRAGAIAGIAAAPKFRGELQAGIAALVEPSAFPEISGVVSTAEHAPPVAGGTVPHFPPPSALQGWAEAKGFGDRGGFIVARAISRRGTRPKPFLGPIIAAMSARARSGVGSLASAIERIFASG